MAAAYYYPAVFLGDKIYKAETGNLPAAGSVYNDSSFLSKLAIASRKKRVCCGYDFNIIIIAGKPS